MSALLPWYWRWVALAAIAIGFAGAGAIKMREHDVVRYNALAEKFAAFRGGIAALAAQAIEQRNATIAADKAAKEKADRENKLAHAADVVTIGELRRQRDSARSSFVPGAAIAAGEPNRACFDRGALESAIRGLFDGIRGGADQCRSIQIDMENARTWAQSLKMATTLDTPP